MQLLTFTAVTENQSVLFAFDPEPANKSGQFSKDYSERIIMHCYAFEASLLGILSLFGVVCQPCRLSDLGVWSCTWRTGFICYCSYFGTGIRTPLTINIKLSMSNLSLDICIKGMNYTYA